MFPRGVMPIPLRRKGCRIVGSDIRWMRPIPLCRSEIVRRRKMDGNAWADRVAAGAF